MSAKPSELVRSRAVRRWPDHTSPPTRGLDDDRRLLSRRLRAVPCRRGQVAGSADELLLNTSGEVYSNAVHSTKTPGRASAGSGWLVIERLGASRGAER